MTSTRRYPTTVCAYARGQITWEQLRLAVAGPGCKETGWYYTDGVGRHVERWPGLVAQAVVDTAREMGWDGLDPEPTGTWCQQWRRDRRSLRRELQGAARCDAALAYVRAEEAK